jgi:hypothetical protein
MKYVKIYFEDKELIYPNDIEKFMSVLYDHFPGEVYRKPFNQITPVVIYIAMRTWKIVPTNFDYDKFNSLWIDFKRKLGPQPF